MGKYLSTVDEIEDEIEFLSGLEGGVQRDEERVVLVVAQDVALGHDVLRLVAPHHRPFLQHFDGVQVLVGVASGQQHFAETASTQNAQKFKIVRFQSAKFTRKGKTIQILV